MNEESDEAVAERLAARGRDALIERLRITFAEAAAAHADLVQIDGDKLEALVQSSADRADGLQWRRALATVASEELGIPVTQALGHPAVRRAQELIGAPSYEDSLTELIRRPVPESAQAALAAAANGTPEPAGDGDEYSEHSGGWGSDPSGAEPDAVAEPDAGTAVEEVPGSELADEAVADETLGDETLGDETVADETVVGETVAGETVADETLGDETVADETAPEQDAGVERGEVPQAADEGGDALTVEAVHLGGVANLSTDNQPIELRLSDVGLDIVRNGDEILGRLAWSDIEALEVPASRGRLRRRAQSRAQLIIRTASGDASFDVPAFTSDELRAKVDLLFERFGRG